MPSCTYYRWDGLRWEYLGSDFHAWERYERWRDSNRCTAVVHHGRTRP